MRSLPLAMMMTMLAPALAHADQCVINSADVTTRAARYLAKHSRAVEFCEPCGDTAPGTPFTITKLEATGGRILVNGAAVDLAYLFVETAPDELKNVGVEAQCGASSVSTYIRNGKPSGPPTARSAPPPLRPAPSPPVSSADDLAGQWSVSLSPRLSTCSTIASRSTDTWDISKRGAALVATNGSGDQFDDSVTAYGTRMFKHVLRPTQQPGTSVVQLTHFTPDRFSGTMLVAEPASKVQDPPCITLIDMTGTRKP